MPSWCRMAFKWGWLPLMDAADHLYRMPACVALFNAENHRKDFDFAENTQATTTKGRPPRIVSQKKP